MLVFPHWRTELPNEACRAMRWAPPERFAPYIARPMVYRPAPLQVEDDTSSGGSSPERDAGAGGGEATVCGWRGCGAIFPGVARLSAHVGRVHAHPHRDGLFYCAWGDCARAHRGFNARYKMLVHVRTHTNERPHTCTQCNKSFSRAENLKIHLRSHSGEKPYVCPYEGCGKAYSNSSDRFKHTRTHTVDKPYCCKVAGCNKRYTDPSSLRKHVKTYKHFTPKEIIRQESSDDMHSQYSLQDHASYPDMESTSHSYLSPPRTAVSPVYSSISPVPRPIIRYAPPVEQLTYLRPSPPLHPLRVPTYEMSYLEYTQMYEHAYRSYYSANMDYTLRATVCEKTLSYEDVTMTERRQGSPEITRYEDEEMPLNLISSKRLDCKPVEELVRRTDLPLDLSVKT